MRVRTWMVAVAVTSVATEARSQAMPGLNVKTYCINQAAMQQGPVSPDFLTNCMASEVDAADDLGSIWSALPAEARQACLPPPVQDARAPVPGYADMRACVERVMGM